MRFLFDVLGNYAVFAQIPGKSLSSGLGPSGRVPRTGSRTPSGRGFGELPRVVRTDFPGLPWNLAKPVNSRTQGLPGLGGFPPNLANLELTVRSRNSQEFEV